MFLPTFFFATISLATIGLSQAVETCAKDSCGPQQGDALLQRNSESSSEELALTEDVDQRESKQLVRGLLVTRGARSKGTMSDRTDNAVTGNSMEEILWLKSCRKFYGYKSCNGNRPDPDTAPAGTSCHSSTRVYGQGFWPTCECCPQSSLLQHKSTSPSEDLALAEDLADKVVQTVKHDLIADTRMKGLVDALSSVDVGEEKLLETFQDVAKEYLNGFDVASLSDNDVDEWLSQKGFTSAQIDVVNQYLGDLDAMAKEELGKYQKAEVSLSQRAARGDSNVKENRNLDAAAELKEGGIPGTDIVRIRR